MKYFYNPSARLEVWILFFLLFLFSSGNDVRIVVTLNHGILLSRIASIQAKILRTFLCRFRARKHDTIQSLLQQFAVMSICTVQYN